MATHNSVDPRLCQSMSQFIHFDSKFNLNEEKQSERSYERRYSKVNRSYNNFVSSPEITRVETDHYRKEPSSRSLRRIKLEQRCFSNTKSNTRNSEIEHRGPDVAKVYSNYMQPYQDFEFSAPNTAHVTNRGPRQLNSEFASARNSNAQQTGRAKTSHLRNRSKSKLSASTSNLAEPVHHQFGITGYKIGKPFYNDSKNLLVFNWKNENASKKSCKYTFLDDVVKDFKKHANQATYLKHENWKEENCKTHLHGHYHKSEFSKMPRHTINEVLMRRAKKENKPPPGRYNLPKHPIPSIANFQGEQRMVVDDARWKAMQVPGFKYEIASGVKITKPKVFELKIQPAKEKPESCLKIKKGQDPCIGFYNDEESFRKTQLRFNSRKMVVTTLSKKTTFVDDAVRSRKALLAPNHYSNLERSFSRISPPPISIRKRRH